MSSMGYDIVNLNAMDIRSSIENCKLFVIVKVFEDASNHWWSSTCIFSTLKKRCLICADLYFLLLCFELNYSANFPAFLKVFFAINSKKKKKKKEQWIKSAHKRNNIQLTINYANESIFGFFWSPMVRKKGAFSIMYGDIAFCWLRKMRCEKCVDSLFIKLRN